MKQPLLVCRICFRTRISLVLCAFCLHFSALAQQQAMGATIGLNFLASDNTTQAFGRPHFGIGVDYFFPDYASTKFLKKYYDRLFSSPKLQLRGQMSVNQFYLKNQPNTSITSVGASVLYFPKAYDYKQKRHFLTEFGYKAGWHSETSAPFHNLFGGIGTRHKLKNDWFLQTNLQYTFAFYDRLDREGRVGFRVKNTDSYLFVGATFLKSFLSVSEAQIREKAKDSLATARSLAMIVIEHTEKNKQSLVLVQDKLLKTALQLDSLNKLLKKRLIRNTDILAEVARLREKLRQYSYDEASKTALDNLIAELNQLQIANYIEKQNAISIAETLKLFDIDIAIAEKNLIDEKENLANAKRFLPFLPSEKTNTYDINQNYVQKAYLNIKAIETNLQKIQDKQILLKTNEKQVQLSIENIEKMTQKINDVIEE